METKSCVKTSIENTISKTQCDLIPSSERNISQWHKQENLEIPLENILSYQGILPYDILVYFLYLYTHTFIYIYVYTHRIVQGYIQTLLLPRFH